ncbi:synaptonemal complex protein ZEP1-like [Lingula anatina]|uniref:Synaptonemal complex protein ZEP1-like n=1 Tax=Lingula anatina TaxID=7574 RepID=A0A1S3I823_LINAN|nr:synaptonemal complex protein ZEP1-like [Lingula anatina]|eukprot:XP_013394011.1 synaptonemal complex protein ZEP1-like [Lingula anatina]
MGRVKEGIKINQQLSETNTNLREELGSKEVVIDGLRQELVETKASLSSQPQDVVEKMSRLQHSVDSLEKELKSQEDMVKGLREQLAETVTEKNTLTSSLNEAHLLVDRHVQSNTSLTTQLTTAQADLEALRTQNDQLKVDSEAVAGQMKEQEVLHQEEKEAWKKEETSLQDRLSSLQKDYEVLSKAHGSLEELNTMWAGRNVDLTEEVERLKEVLNKPKTDQDQQTDPKEQCTVDVQTKVIGHHTVDTQTEGDYSGVDTRAVYCQTVGEELYSIAKTPVCSYSFQANIFLLLEFHQIACLIRKAWHMWSKGDGSWWRFCNSLSVHRPQYCTKVFWPSI